MIVARSLGDFLRRVAFDAVSHGYLHYALREIPIDKDPMLVDRKLILAYEITRCSTKRMRRRRQGFANVLGIRWGHSFVLLASLGKHTAFEKVRNYDIRLAPLHFGGYSIGIVSGRVSVQVAHDVWEKTKQQLLALCLEDKQVVERSLASLTFYHFAGVLSQKRSLVTAINAHRKAAGLVPVVDTLPHQVSARLRRYSKRK